MSFSTQSQLKNELIPFHPNLLFMGFTEADIETMHLPVELAIYSKTLTKVNKKPIYITKRPFAMDFSYNGKSYILVIDQDNLTNLATVPWILQWVLKADDRYVKEQAVAHDVLVKEFTSLSPKRTLYGYVLIEKSTGIITRSITPKFADIIFRELIEESLRRNMRLNEYTAKVKAAIAYGAITTWRYVMKLF